MLCDDLEGGWEEGRFMMEGTYIYIYNYDWLVLMYDRAHHIVKQLSSNKNILKFLKKSMSSKGQL